MKNQYKTLLILTAGLACLLMAIYTNDFQTIIDLFPEISPSVSAGVPRP